MRATLVAAHRTPAAACPHAWAKGWLELANKIETPVYCPTWMPNPLKAQIGGEWQKPTCKTIVLAGKNETLHGGTPCFADPHGAEKANGIRATVYTVDQDADQWHVLFLWRHKGSLYTVSEHVIKPYTYGQVVHNLDKMLRSLVLVGPTR